jgi:hypothetical protein
MSATEPVVPDTLVSPASDPRAAMDTAWLEDDAEQHLSQVAEVEHDGDGSSDSSIDDSESDGSSQSDTEIDSAIGEARERKSTSGSHGSSKSNDEAEGGEGADDEEEEDNQGGVGDSNDDVDDDESKWAFVPDDLGGLNDKLWVPCAQGSTDVWSVADVITYSKDRSTVTVSVDASTQSAGSMDGNERASELAVENEEDNMELLVQTFPVSSTFAFHESHLQDCPNAALLSDLNDPALLSLLRYRYTHGSIYTLSGDILVSINPNSIMPDIAGIVSADEERMLATLMDKTNSQTPPEGNDVHVPEAIPHIFAIAKRAHDNLMETQRDQSILINGESGSGKTEASKAVLRCLGAMSADVMNRDVNMGAKGVTSPGPGVRSPGAEQVVDIVQSVNSSIVASNPVLEAFGNAMTGSNANSSRFGKFMQLSYKDGSIVGASTNHFLLETSRVISHSYGERNFHVFYRMLAGLSDADKVLLDIDG